MDSDRAVDIGSRLELMVDDYLIDRMDGDVTLRLHRPCPKEVSLVMARAWEGNMSGCYVTVFRDGDKYRMYYKASRWDLSTGQSIGADSVAYVESKDGIHWVRPDLGLYDFEGSKKNNIVWEGRGAHGFAPFKDPNPACPPEAQYKAVGCANETLYAMISPDGIHWSPMRDEPIITTGKFDSQNLAFWDSVREEYRAYVRDFRNGRRDIRTAVSQDFVNWTDPVWLEYPGAPDEQLYTNQIIPYYRAPHIFVGFPTRYVERPWSESIEALPELEHRRTRSDLSERYGAALTDGLFMSSRDGKSFKRWGEAFLRPGPRATGNWAYGDNYQNWGLVETKSDVPGAPRELSIYASEGYWRGNGSQLRRHTLRIDGFVSVNAPLSGGQFITKPLRFKGNALVLNVSTSAAGSVLVEIQDASASPIQGFGLGDCVEIIGDTISHTVQWQNATDVSRLCGQPVRLRFVMKDADLYSFRFATR